MSISKLFGHTLYRSFGGKNNIGLLLLEQAIYYRQINKYNLWINQYMKRLLTNTIQLNWLRTFEVASRHLSFTNAAEELSMSQSAISQQIQLLEHHLDQKLFIRANRTIRLTDAGRAFLPLVCDSLRQLNAGAAQIFSDAKDAVVDVNINATFATMWLAPRLVSFNQLEPQISIRQRSTNWSADFDISTADLEIRYGLGGWDGFESYPLINPLIRPYCSGAMVHELSTPRALASVPLIDVEGTPQGWDQWLNAYDVCMHEKCARQYTDSHTSAAALAANGAGICLMYDDFMQMGVLSNILVAPFEERVSTDSNYYLCHHTDKCLTRPSRVFKEWLLDTCK